MVVSYELTGDWTDGIPKSSKSEFIIGVFKSNSANIIKQNGMSLEEYLRKSEKADHMSWGDLSEIDFRPNIVSKIQGHVRRKITGDYGEISRGGGEHKNLGLGKRLADLLLPPTDYSSWDEGLGGQQGDGGSGGSAGAGEGTPPKTSKKNKKPVLKAYGIPVYGKNEIKQRVQISLGNKSKVRVVVMVLTETSAVKGDTWESEGYLDKPFPVRVDSIVVDRIFIAGSEKSSQKIKAAVTVDKDTKVWDIDFAFIKTNKYKIQQGFEITAPDNKGYIIEGTVSFSLDNIRGVLALESE